MVYKVQKAPNIVEMLSDLSTPTEIATVLVNYIQDELTLVSEGFLTIENIFLPELNVEPSKPRNGMIVLADGTNWDPGSGAGYYGYRNASWNFLG